MKKTYKIEVDCANCANKMEEAAKNTKGVKDATVNFMTLKMIVEFEEGRIVEYPFGQLDELVLAYAITVHKSQGSEYPAVVMPLLSGPRLLFNRNVLYTGVTRAKKCVTIIGSPETIQKMIQNEMEMKRYSGLEEAIRQINQ